VPPEELALSPLGRASSTGEWLEAVFREHYPRLVAVVTRLTGNRAQAEEIAAEAFSRLAGRSTLLAGRADAAAWVYRVATNAAVDTLRANSRRRKLEDQASTERARRDSGASALDDLIRTERAARVRGVLASMKPRDAQLLLLRSSDLAYREIARALGVQAGSVGTLLARAEREFERRYRTRYGDDV